MGLIFIQIFVIGSERRMRFETQCVMVLQCHLYKVVDFGTNESAYAISSNLGPVLPRFRDIAGFLLRTTPPLFQPNFRGVPFGLDWRCCGREERRP